MTSVPALQTRILKRLALAVLVAIAIVSPLSAQESAQPTKETLIGDLHVVVDQVLAEKYAETEKYFYLPEDFEHRMFENLIKRDVISKKGVEALGLGGEFGKAVGVLKKSEVEATAAEFSVPVERCYAMKMKQGDQSCKVIAHWTGEHFKILDINRVGKMDSDKVALTVQAPIQPWPTGDQPTKELLIDTLKVFLHTIENKHYDALRPNVYVPDDFVMSRFQDSLERDELSAKGIEVLGEKGAFGKADEVYNKLRAAALTKRVSVPVAESYGFVAKIGGEEGEVLAHWIGDRYKLIRTDDIGKLPAALLAESKTPPAQPAAPVEAAPSAAKPDPAVSNTTQPSNVAASLPKYETDKKVVMANYPALMTAVAENPNDVSLRARFVQSLLVIGNTPKAWEEALAIYRLDPQNIEVVHAIDKSMEGLKANGIFQVGVPEETFVALMGEPISKIDADGFNRWQYPLWNVDFNDGRFAKLSRVEVAAATSPATEAVPEKVEQAEAGRFGLKLMSYEKRLNAVHKIRIDKELGLKETMKLIEELPAVIFADLTKSEAEEKKASYAAKGLVTEIFEMKAAEEFPAKVAVPATFSVEMSSFGTNKIAVIKVIRALNKGMSLREAKQLTDTVPSTVLKGVSQEQADAAKEKLLAAGASVEIK